MLDPNPIRPGRVRDRAAGGADRRDRKRIAALLDTFRGGLPMYLIAKITGITKRRLVVMLSHDWFFERRGRFILTDAGRANGLGASDGN